MSEDGEFRVEGIDHVEVFVRDLEAAAAWYGDVLGLERIGSGSSQPVMVGAGKTWLAMFQARDEPEGDGNDLRDTRAPHWRRVAWRVPRDRFEAAQRHLTERGVKFQGPVEHTIAHSIYFEDPDGNPLEITTYVAPRAG